MFGPRRIPCLKLTAALILSLAGCVAPGTPAYAEIRTSDVVLGESADARGISASELPDIQAPEAIVMDKDGTAYYERDADKEVRIASITKVMTAILTLENTAGNETLTIDHRAATVGQSSADLKEGDVLTVTDCLRALMIPSGNDAAMALATFVGAKIDPASADPYATFINAMNAKAADLGMEHTLFENPHGLDFDGWEGNLHSTARDVATMFRYAMQNEAFRALTANDDNKLTVTGADGAQRTIDMIKRNTILGQGGNIGGKTGGTYEAFQCFVGAFERDGREIYTVTLGSETGEQRWADTMAIAEWYYGHWTTVPFANTSVKTGDTPIVAEATCTDWTDKTARLTVSDSQASTEAVFSLAGSLEQDVELLELAGEVKQGTAGGTLAYLQDGKRVGEIDLVTCESVPQPNPLEWVMVQFDRLVRLFTGEPGTAKSAVHNEVPDPLAYDAWGLEA